MITDTRFCACGCGKRLRKDNRSGYFHSQKDGQNHAVHPQQMYPCLCGCGRIIGKPEAFAVGHYARRKGQIQSVEEQRATARRWYERNKARVRERKQAYRAAHPEVYRASAQRYREKNSHRLKDLRAKWRQDKVGGCQISRAQLQAMREEQDNACAACARKGLQLVIDHCHETGKVRGLLCRRCNGIAQHYDTVSAVLRYMEQRR